MEYNESQNGFKKQCVDAIVTLDNDLTVSNEQFGECCKDLMMFLASAAMSNERIEPITIRGDNEIDGVLQIVISKEPI